MPAIGFWVIQVAEHPCTVRADLNARRLQPICQPMAAEVVGDVADTRYMTEGIFAKASSENKTLTLIPGASHIEAYGL